MRGLRGRVYLCVCLPFCLHLQMQMRCDAMRGARLCVRSRLSSAVLSSSVLRLHVCGDLARRGNSEHFLRLIGDKVLDAPGRRKVGMRRMHARKRLKTPEWGGG